MKKIFVTRPIPLSGIKLLKNKKYKVTVSPYDRVLKPSEIIKMGKGCDALLCLLTDNINAKVLDGLGDQLKIVANYAVGFNNIDLLACRQRGVKVSNTPGVLSNSVAEHTFALIMALGKRIVEADKFTLAGKYKGWGPMLFLGTELKGKTLGIVGLGRIGKRVSEIAVKGFGMNVVYSDLFRDKKYESRFKAKHLSVTELFKQSDFISIHVPLLPSTVHLVDRKKISLMKKTAFLINTSRGPVVSEKDLYAALLKNKIAGAALDVFECEPAFACDPKKRKQVRALNNLILTPHIASAAIETRSAMSELAALNIIAALSGKKLLTEVKK